MSSFNLNSGNTEFNDRQKKVFDQLLVLENNRKSLPSEESNRNDQRPNRDNRRAQKSETKHFRGKESMFKRPQNPAPRNYINKIPDFKKNPHKWTKYSLEDVQDVTEESNTKSAMDFLKQLAERRKAEQGIIEEPKLTELPSKIVFNTHIKTRKDTAQEDQDNKMSFSSSKLIMPEYVIGQNAVKKSKSSKKNKPEKGVELKLDHLSYEDE
ncbi:protein TSSC4 [Anthonomus grandis grandis]|uniref:protein TSSC4 n=1 Tax=Anthonomus grandis grandis TaxID=2921223 RepID=UPI0021669080|nr:protein TSSC4 [Anthonomus grandis grandis]